MVDRGIPKIIHAFWLQGASKAPPLVKACLGSWQHHNPGWTVTILDRSGLASALTENERALAAKMSPAALSDLLRLSLLLRQGGIWVDATLACQTPLETWLPDVLTHGFFAFDRPGPDRPVASWFLAARPGHPIIDAWHALACSLWALPDVVGVDPVDQSRRYLDEARYGPKPWRQKSFWEGLTHLPYFWVHYLFDYLVTTDRAYGEAWADIPKMSAHLPQNLQRRGLIGGPGGDATLSTFIAASPTPVQKLNWRKHNFDDHAGLKALFPYI